MTEPISVYFDAGWDRSNEALLDDLRKQTPDERAAWGDISAVESPAEAEYHVALNRPTVESDAMLVLFTMEPPPLSDCGRWDQYDAWRTFPTPTYSRPQRWWIEKTYDELRGTDPPEKNANLSWVTSDNGLHVHDAYRRLRTGLRNIGYRPHRKKHLGVLNTPTDGHLLRMSFYKRLVAHTDGLLDLYGRGNFDYEGYRGPVEDKFDGLAGYRYSLAIENYEGPNYWSEKLGDALLAWCMPIYWGCTNLEEYLPEDSFVRIDIESDDVVARVEEVVNSNRRERNLDAIAEARRRILDEYQMWPVVERTVTGGEPFGKVQVDSRSSGTE